MDKPVKRILITLITAALLGLALFMDPSSLGWLFSDPPKISHFDYPISHPILEKEDFAICYDSKNKIPLWTLETLEHDDKELKIARKDALFAKDEALYKLHQASLSDYKNSGFDRGHLCPAKNHKQSIKAYKDTFLLSNICPMKANFNRGAWKQLEDYAYGLKKRNSRVTIISGPLFLSSKGKISYCVIGKHRVAAPTHFFKVLHIEGIDGKRRTESFVLDAQNPPQTIFTDSTNAHIHPKFVRSLAFVEEASGLTFPNHYK